MSDDVVTISEDNISISASGDMRDISSQILKKLRQEKTDRRMINKILHLLKEMEQRLEKDSSTHKAEAEEAIGRAIIQAEEGKSDFAGNVANFLGAIFIIIWVIQVFTGFASEGFIGGILGLIAATIMTGITGVVVVGLITLFLESVVEPGLTKEIRANGLARRDTLVKKFTEEHETYRYALNEIEKHRTLIDQGVEDFTQFQIGRCHYLSEQYKETCLIVADPQDYENKGKPTVTWGLEDPMDRLKFEELEPALDTFPFDPDTDTIFPEIKIYSNTGSLLRDDIEKNADLLHRESLALDGQFIDHGAKAGETINYYVVVSGSFDVLAKKTDGEYKDIRHTHHILAKHQRVTVPHPLSESEKLERDKQARATAKQRERFEEVVEKEERAASGHNATELGEEVLQKALAKKQKKKEVEATIERLTKELTEAGFSEEEIEEEIESYLSKLDQ